NKRIHVIHSNTYIPALSGQVASSLTGIPHVVTFHDVYSLLGSNFWDRWMGQTSSRVNLWTVARGLESVVARLPVKAFHTVSEISSDDLVRFGVNRPIRVIPNGVELSDYTSSDSRADGRPFALYIGRLVFYKNIPTILHATKRVVAVRPEFRLVIVGGGPLTSKLAELANSLGIAANTVFVGVVSHSEKVRLLNECSFLVLPSLFEGFGLVILEAFACHRPVICSDLRPMSDLVMSGSEGILVEPRDHHAWAKAMLHLLEDAHSASEMGVRGHQKVLKSFTIQRACDELEDLYMSIIS
ncbi:MAG: glycosyltransferase family 4 protein, partial [Candidatus Geothermarchaeales archaeon]